MDIPDPQQPSKALACIHAYMHTYIHTHTYIYIHSHGHMDIPDPQQPSKALGKRLFSCLFLLWLYERWTWQVASV